MIHPYPPKSYTEIWQESHDAGRKLLHILCKWLCKSQKDIPRGGNKILTYIRACKARRQVPSWHETEGNNNAGNPLKTFSSKLLDKVFGFTPFAFFCCLLLNQLAHTGITMCTEHTYYILHQISCSRHSNSFSITKFGTCKYAEMFSARYLYDNKFFVSAKNYLPTRWI